MNTKQWDIHSFGDFDSFEIHPLNDEHGTTILAKIDAECAGTPKEKEKRARLISAAPDLLSAAMDALESLKRLKDADGAYRVTNISQLQDAIKKAGV